LYQGERRDIGSACLCAVEYAGHHNFVAVVVEFMDDDVGQSRHRPLIGTGHDADTTKLGECAEAVGLGQDATDDVRGGAWTAGFDIELDSSSGRPVSAAGHAHMAGKGRTAVAPIDDEIVPLRLARDCLVDRGIE
jgi:hypothetical protein